MISLIKIINEIKRVNNTNPYFENGQDLLNSAEAIPSIYDDDFDGADVVLDETGFARDEEEVAKLNEITKEVGLLTKQEVLSALVYWYFGIAYDEDGDRITKYFDERFNLFSNLARARLNW